MWKRYPNLDRLDAANSGTGFGHHVKCKMVCFDCRKVCKGDSWFNEQETKHCPHCGKQMINAGKVWRFPKRRDLKGWKKERERFHRWCLAYPNANRMFYSGYLDDVDRRTREAAGTTKMKHYKARN